VAQRPQRQLAALRGGRQQRRRPFGRAVVDHDHLEAIPPDGLGGEPGEEPLEPRGAVARSPRNRPAGQADPEWLGSAIELDALDAAVSAGGMTTERIAGAETQYCLVLARKAPVK